MTSVVVNPESRLQKLGPDELRGRYRLFYFEWQRLSQRVLRQRTLSTNQLKRKRDLEDRLMLSARKLLLAQGIEPQECLGELVKHHIQTCRPRP